MMNYAQVTEQIEQLKIGKKIPDTNTIIEKYINISKNSFSKKLLYIPEKYEYDSVGEFSEAILKEHKLNVGRFTFFAIKMPLGHILYNGKPISQKDFAKYGEQILESIDSDERSDTFTRMEIYFLIALKYFLDKNIDCMIVPDDMRADCADFEKNFADFPIAERNKRNSTMTVSFLEREGFVLEDKSVRKAIEKCKCEGKFELLKKKPYYIADGADSGTATKLLMANLQYYYPNNPYIFIVGALQDGYEEIVKESAMMAGQVITVTPPEYQNAIPAIELAQEFGKLNPNITNTSSVEEAVEIATILADKDTVIVAFGTIMIIERFRQVVLK